MWSGANFRVSQRGGSHERPTGARVPGPGWRALAVVALAVLGLGLAACGGPDAGVGRAPTRAAATATARPSVVYVALGASDAVGVGADNPNTQGYVPRLIARLPASAQALNLGVSGITLHDALTEEVPPALAAHPTLMTVWLAANDFKDCVPLAQYGADLNTLLALLQAHTQARVFVADLPDLSELPVFQNGAAQAGPCTQGETAAQIRAKVLQWNQVIDAAVARHGDFLVDLFNSQLAAHPEYIYRDGFHPSSAGYAVLADLFSTQIQAHGGAPRA